MNVISFYGTLSSYVVNEIIVKSDVGKYTFKTVSSFPRNMASFNIIILTFFTLWCLYFGTYQRSVSFRGIKTINAMVNCC